MAPIFIALLIVACVTFAEFYWAAMTTGRCRWT